MLHGEPDRLNGRLLPEVALLHRGDHTCGPTTVTQGALVVRGEARRDTGAVARADAVGRDGVASRLLRFVDNSERQAAAAGNVQRAGTVQPHGRAAMIADPQRASRDDDVRTLP